MENCYVVLHDMGYDGIDIWGLFSNKERIKEAFLDSIPRIKENLLKYNYEIFKYDGTAVLSRQLLSDFLEDH